MSSETVTAPPRKKRAARVRPSSLAIVEHGFRGALEEQYGNIVWLSECMKSMGANHNLLLCGPAVACALDGQGRQDLQVGPLQITTVGHFPDAIGRLLAKGAQIWVLQGDLDRFAPTARLLPGVQTAPSMAALIAQHDKAWFW